MLEVVWREAYGSAQVRLCLTVPALPHEGLRQVVANVVVVFHGEGMGKERLAIVPVADLPQGEERQYHKNSAGRSHDRRSPLRMFLRPFRDAPNHGDDNSNHWDMGEAIRNRLPSGLNQANVWKKYEEEPHPPDEQPTPLFPLPECKPRDSRELESREDHRQR